MFEDPNRIWNLDETAVNATYGKRVRVFTSARNNSGGRRHNIKDNGAHVTAVIAASACRLYAPPFFVAAGKKVMPGWKKNIDHLDAHKLPSDLRWMCETEWPPRDTKISTTAKGSMTMNLMPDLVKHFNTFVRKTVPPEKLVLLLLDGHSSRRGDEWILYCQEANIVVVQLPANTSHFLQPCNSSINKTFKERTREVRDILVRTGLYGNANIAFKIKLGVAGYMSLTSQIARQSFINTGMWPMEFHFFETLRRRLNNQVRSSAPSSNGSIKSLRMTKRTSDSVLFSRIKAIVQREPCATQALCMIEQTLQENCSTHRILWEAAPLQAPVRGAQKSAAHSCGAPASVLTNRGAMKDILNTERGRMTQADGVRKYNWSVAPAVLESSVKLNKWDVNADDDIPIMTAWRLRRLVLRGIGKKNEPAASAAGALLDLAKGG